MFLKTKLLWLIIPLYLLAVLDELLYTEAYMNSVRVEEIPFALQRNHSRTRESALKHPAEERRNIFGLKRLDQHRGFLKIFNVPCKLLREYEELNCIIYSYWHLLNGFVRLYTLSF